jgi:hypothetical protein
VPLWNCWQRKPPFASFKNLDSPGLTQSTVLAEKDDDTFEIRHPNRQMESKEYTAMDAPMYRSAASQ